MKWTSERARKWGRKGGLIGGAIRSRILSPERRRQIARAGGIAKALKAKGLNTA